MNSKTARDLIITYLDHIAQNLNMDSLKEEQATLAVAQKLDVKHYQVFTCQFLNEPESELAFLFVYIDSPDRIIAHKLFNLIADLSWHFSRQQRDIMPSVIPVLIYNGDQDFEPQSLKQIYTSPERAPEFYFEFINLKKHINYVIGD